MHRTSPLIIANWKMHKTSHEARQFIEKLLAHLTPSSHPVWIAPAFTALEASVEAAANSSLVIGAQNMSEHLTGPYTGEISAGMLKAAGAQFVLLGHSERRAHFGESNQIVNRKLLCALSQQLGAVLCVGETLQQRQDGLYKEVLHTQLTDCLQGVERTEQLFIAYEPIWAIGTGKTATPEIAQEIHSQIRAILSQRFGQREAQRIPLLYGGSVKPELTASLLAEPDIDGVLVGGASLEVTSLAMIANVKESQ